MIASCSQLLCDVSRYPVFDDVLEVICGHGFSAIDVGAFETWGQGLSPSRLADDREYFSRTVRSVRRSGLSVASVNCAPGPKLIGDGADLDRYVVELSALIRLASEVGADRMTLQVPPRPDGWDDTRCADAFVEAWSHVLGAVDARDIRMSVEAHAGTFMERPLVAVGVVRRLWPSLGFTYDPSHQITIGVPLSETTAMFDYLVHVHLRDARRGEMQAVWGTGELDARWVLDQVARVGHTAPVCIEYFGGFDAQFVSTLAARAAIEAFPG